MTTDTPMQFEIAYARLEEILEKIHSGKVSLEDSLKLYEEADKLIQWCSTRLNEAEKKIEILVKNREGQLNLNQDGQPQTQPFATMSSAPLQSRNLS